MTVSSYSELLEHFGHSTAIALYGDENITVECTECDEILVEFFNGEEEDFDFEYPALTLVTDNDTLKEEEE